MFEILLFANLPRRFLAAGIRNAICTPFDNIGHAITKFVTDQLGIFGTTILDGIVKQRRHRLVLISPVIKCNRCDPHGVRDIGNVSPFPLLSSVRLNS